MMQKDAVDSIKIRGMSSDDIPEVAEIERATFSEPWSGKGFAESLAQEYNLFLVAQAPDGSILGYCGLYLAVDEAEITNVAVREANRQSGIGDALLGALLREAEQRGARLVYLEVRVSNQAAICLYRKHGFAPFDIRKGFYRWPDEDALVMRRISRADKS